MTDETEDEAATAARALGRIGGRSKSKKKAEAARKNGKRGGWHAQKRNQVQP